MHPHIMALKMLFLLDKAGGWGMVHWVLKITFDNGRTEGARLEGARCTEVALTEQSWHGKKVNSKCLYCMNTSFGCFLADWSTGPPHMSGSFSPPT